MPTKFQQQVWSVTRQIPKGKVATYGQIARKIGNPRASRAVGTALSVNPDAPRTPCHRVVAIDGSLNGYSASGGLSAKRKLLEAEGVKFIGNKVDLSQFLLK